MLQTDLNNLDLWFRSNMLSLNISKTNTMTIKPKNTTAISDIKLNNKTLPIVDNTKFLGVTIDNNLLWAKHINSVISKFSINKELTSKSEASPTPEAKRHIYYAHIHSHLTYANTVWSGRMTKQTKELDRKNTKTLYMIHNNSKKTSHTDPQFIALKIITIKEISKYELCKLTYNKKKSYYPKRS